MFRCTENARWRAALICAASLACVVGCVRTPSVPPSTVAERLRAELIPFTATSLDNTFFAFVGEFEAAYAIEADSIFVIVHQARVRLRDAPGVRGPRQLDSIQVRLAHARGPSWALSEQSARTAHVVGRRMQSGDEIQLDSLRFSIAQPDTPLEQHWLVFELVGRLIETNGEPGNPGSAYVHSNRNIFSQH